MISVGRADLLSEAVFGLARRGPLKGRVPWFTLSEAVWALERWWWPLRVALAAAAPS